MYVRIQHYSIYILVNVLLISFSSKHFRSGKKNYWTFNTSQMRGLLIRDQFWKGHLVWFILQSPQGSCQLNSAGERNLWPSEQAYGYCLYLTERGNKTLLIRQIGRGETEPWKYFIHTDNIITEKHDTGKSSHYIWNICWVMVTVCGHVLPSMWTEQRTYRELVLVK